MIRSICTLLVAAALSLGAIAQTQPKGAATSLELNAQGVGHILVVPYFSTQGGNATLLSVTNASAVPKAVKIRFRGAGNGDELASLQVFLLARDAFTVNVSAGVDGVPVLSTSDRSCTLPQAIDGRRFSTSRLNPALAGDALANQAREGYVEIIAMGDVLAGSTLLFTMQPASPTRCAPFALNALGRFDSQLGPPSTGLMASWVLINVPQTTTWAGEAVAFEARLNGEASTGNVVFFPQSAAPLSNADVTNYTADPLFKFANGGPITVGTSADLPDPSTPYTAAGRTPQQQATDLSFLLAAQEIAVEYTTASSISASTDWVLSMPTRRSHVALDYRGPTLITNRTTFGDSSAVYFDFIAIPLWAPGQACFYQSGFYLIDGYDREGFSTTFAYQVQPGPGPITYCGAVSVLSPGDANQTTSTTLHAAITRTSLLAPASDRDGLALFKWPLQGPKGLPVLVRQFSRAVNPQAAPGVSGTYGATWPGRVTVRGAMP